MILKQNASKTIASIVIILCVSSKNSIAKEKEPAHSPDSTDMTLTTLEASTKALKIETLNGKFKFLGKMYSGHKKGEAIGNVDIPELTAETISSPSRFHTTMAGARLGSIGPGWLKVLTVPYGAIEAYKAHDALIKQPIKNKVSDLLEPLRDQRPEFDKREKSDNKILKEEPRIVREICSGSRSGIGFMNPAERKKLCGDNVEPDETPFGLKDKRKLCKGSRSGIGFMNPEDRKKLCGDTINDNNTPLALQDKERPIANENKPRENCDNIVFTMPPDMIDFTRNNLNKWKKMRPHSAYTRGLKKKSIAELEATLKDFENTKSKKQACLDRNNQLNKEDENDNINSEEEITTIIPEQKKIEENHTEIKPIEQKTEDNVKRSKPVLKKSPYVHKPGSHRAGKEIKKPKLWNDVTSEDLKKYIELMKKIQY